MDPPQNYTLNAENKMHRVTREANHIEIVIEILKQISRAEICVSLL